MIISIFKQIEKSEEISSGFRALLNAYLELTRFLPKAALPASPPLSERCKEEVEKLAALLDDTPPVEVIEEAGRIALGQFEAIYHSNRAALDERDTALKDVVTSVAQAMSSFKGHGERHEGTLSRMADEFDSLARLDNVADMRRRLREHVSKLRDAAHEMRRESDQAIRQFATQISSYQNRLEMARKETGLDRLTGLGSRREADRNLRSLDRRQGVVCVLLFDVEGFRALNTRYGALFGDKLLRALAHLLHQWFPDNDVLFRWGPDEFLVIAESSLATCRERCCAICKAFAAGGMYHTTLDDGTRIELAASVAFGAVQYLHGEPPENIYRRVRASLDDSRTRTQR